MASIVQIQLRRDTAANWATANPVLAQGEPAIELDTGRLKFGDGTTAYNSLPYFEADKNFIFVQGVADANWVVAHNLGKFPSVSVFDSADTPLKGQVEHVDNNNLIIKFNKAVSGKAYLN
jgi:hypothetical protein